MAAGAVVWVGDGTTADGWAVGRDVGSTVCEGVALLSGLGVGLLAAVAAAATTTGLVAVGGTLG